MFVLLYCDGFVNRGRIVEMNYTEPSKHSVKCECKSHKKCVVWRQLKNLPANAEQRLLDWLWLGHTTCKGDANSARHQQLLQSMLQ